ncbi:TRAP transporter small permease [uncultured Roseibium sp.]|uniref:TRAP transporter small permease n=1 Tax=uncultured Roseibium sp. TaxID=1936171 RepID=UPI002625CD97|nr:TRAP transporter small permease [uncultured Roseibium sp.]
MAVDPASIEKLLQEQEAEQTKAAEGNRLSLTDYVLLAIFLTLFVVVFLQFFTRYVLNDSIAWTEEAARYLLIILGFAGAFKCQQLDLHIRLEFVDHWLPRQAKYLKFFALIATTVFFAFCGYSLLELIEKTSFQHMVSLPFPKYYLYYVLLASIVAIVCLQLVQLTRAFRTLFK